MADHAKGTPAFYDLVLDAKNLKDDAMRLFAEIRPSWKIDDLEVETFSEGYVNCLMCFRLRSDEVYKDAIVFRVYGGLREEMKLLSSDKELCFIQLAQHAGCFRPILAVFRNGVAYQYAPGRTLSMVDFLDTQMIRVITRKLVAFHHFDETSVPLINHKGESCKLTDVGGLSPEAKLQGFLRMVPASLPEPEKDAIYQKIRMKEDEYLPSYKAMKETIDELNLNKTHSHGDFHMKNMVYDANSGDIVFLDYEMSEIDRPEATDLAKLFSFRPTLQNIGMVKPDEPDFTPEVRLEWIRCYLEAKYAHFGKDPADIPEVLVEFNEVEHAILEAYNALSFTIMHHVLCGGMKDLFKMDPLEKIPALKAIWVEKKQGLPALVERYKQLKEECIKLGCL